jgi:hypothetical protein
MDDKGDEKGKGQGQGGGEMQWKAVVEQPKKRRWFQFHLSTALILMVSVSFWIGNIIDSCSTWSSTPTVKIMKKGKPIFTGEVADFGRNYGIPFTFLVYSDCPPVMNRPAHIISIEWACFFADTMILVGVLLFFAFLSESLIRQSAARPTIDPSTFAPVECRRHGQA